MRNRQRKTLSLEVSTQQKQVLDQVIAELPLQPAEEPIRGGNELPGLYYHPNSACRVMALTLSAGLDAAGGRSDQALRKLDRAIQVFTLIDDTSGLKHLESLKGQLNDDVIGFLGSTREKVVPYLLRQMEQVAKGPQVAEKAKPRLVQVGTELPEERRTVRASSRGRQGRPDRPPRRPPREEAEEARTPAEESVGAEAPLEAAEAEPVAPEVATAAAEAPAETEITESAAPRATIETDESDVGPTEAEAAAAAAAALAAIEAPYEDVVEDSAPRRFDPDRDLDPEDDRRRRRRRPRNKPEGLERPAAPTEDAPKAEVQPPVEVEPKDAEAEPEPIEYRSQRSGLADELAELALGVLREALRAARQGGDLAGQVSVEVVIGSASGAETPGTAGGRRRRRRRRRPRGE